MIAHLRGSVLSHDGDRLVVEVQGVGYLVHAPATTMAVCTPEQSVALHIHTVVREDALQLYGFASVGERDMFLLLISISGIGPKVALSVLSALPVPDLVAAIGREDVQALSRVPGVGKKTAGRIALELREKIGGVAMPAGAVRVQTAGGPGANRAEAVSALVNLGIPRPRAEMAIKTADADNNASVEELIRHGLRTLSPPT